MATRWTVTFDCAHPPTVARFWASALGYVAKPPPAGFDSWAAWFAAHGVPEEEWDDGAYLADPDGELPTISFLRVPEGKMAKNRVHLDIQAGGGRDIPHEIRWPRVRHKVDELIAIGATVQHEATVDGRPDHVAMTDPEGNEFCVL
jgi:glyoxalase superfamily protein